ncbi:methyltransferase, partial [Candidatus Berkelbacteria bacterium]|nr:methyltransferase [Candidatus Berkelbacteria bacterium]
MNRDLTNRQELIEYLKSHGLWLKKESGQHFLTDRMVLDQIILATKLKPDDRVLEIGPGVGTLTQALTQAVPNGLVLAIEKDFKLVTVLREQFKNQKNVKIVHEDGLQFLQEL